MSRKPLNPVEKALNKFVRDLRKGLYDMPKLTNQNHENFRDIVARSQKVKVPKLDDSVKPEPTEETDESKIRNIIRKKKEEIA